MAKRNRITLKHFFRRGGLPTENQFRDLIDSTLNMVDEGFDKSPENGLEISPLGDKPSLLSFFKSQDVGDPSWTIGYDENKEKLFIQGPEAPPSISLAPDHHVGINKASPEHALDVAGVVASHGRIGTYAEGRVPADGKWHVIADKLSGCNAFEVVAGTGKKRTGHYALMHAFAMNTFHPRGWFFNFLNLKRRITYHQAYYRSLRSKLKLRWRPVSDQSQWRPYGNYRLELRANRDYGPDIYIRYQVSRLWFDDFMDESQSDIKPEGNSGNK